jgi:hypothetical protein
VAKATKTEIPTDSVSGRLGRTDNTLGRDRAFAVNMTDNTPDGSVKLSTKKTVPPGGSDARHAQVGNYCTCDGQYRMLDTEHKDACGKWTRDVRNLPWKKLSNYLWWMKFCMLRWPEKQHFVHHVYWGRWIVINPTDTEIVGCIATFEGMMAPMRSLTDCVIAQLAPNYEIDDLLYPQAFTPSSVTACVKSVPALGSKLIDVYWIYNPPERWTA